MTLNITAIISGGAQSGASLYTHGGAFLSHLGEPPFESELGQTLPSTPLKSEGVTLMKPDIEKHNPSPAHIAKLMEKSGLGKGAVCKALGITTMRYYLADEKSPDFRPCPYDIQFALEGLSTERAPDASLSDPSPERLRELLDLAGLAQATAAKMLGLAPRTMRYYLASPQNPQYREARYTVQYALESLAIAKLSEAEAETETNKAD